jgi:hypothetical protein
LEKTIQTKDEVLAELMAEHVALKKLSFSKTHTIGELITYGCGRRHVKPGF